MTENLTWMEKYYKVVHNNFDTEDIFIKASAYHLVSSLLGRFAICPEHPYQSIENMTKPNLMFLLSSPPGAFSRSNIQSCDDVVWQNALKSFYEDTNPMIKGKTDEDETKPFSELEGFEKKSFLRNFTIQEGTCEGIKDHIGPFCEDYPDLKFFDFKGDEFGMTLEMMQQGQYQRGLAGLISKLYDGKSDGQRLSKRKGNRNRYIPPGVYATMLCGMQEPDLYIPVSMVRQGLFRRILVVYTDEKTTYYPLLCNREGIGEELKNLAVEIKDIMIKYNSYREHINCFFSSDLSDTINYSFDKKYRMNNSKGLLTNVTCTIGSILTKLCLLEAIQNPMNVHDEDSPLIRIKQEHYDKAYDFLQDVMKPWDEIYTRIGRKKEMLTDRTDIYARILDIIKENNGIINQAKLLKKLNIPAEQFEVIKLDMKKRGELNYNTIPTKGRPRTDIFIPGK